MVKEKGISTEELFEEARQRGVSAMIQIASDPGSLEPSKEMAHSVQDPQLYYTVGSHPNEVGEYDHRIAIDFARANREDNRFVAVGEIGLDYYYSAEKREQQIGVFREFLDLAVELKKPVCIHTREAFDDTLSILKEYQGLKVLIHCFTGNLSQMEKFVEIGACISFSGIVTFKNAAEIQEALAGCPAERILAETDAPFLAPVPHRGKTNRPAWVQDVIRFIAEHRNDDSLPQTIYNNTRQFFRI